MTAPDLSWFASAVVATRAPDEVIAEAGAIYMERWTLEKSGPGGSQVCVHRYTRPDWAPDPHDHVGDNSTYVVRGRLVDVAYEERFGRGFGWHPEPRILMPGGFLIRRAEDLHIVTEVEPGTVTVWCRGPRVRDWGFRVLNGGEWVPADQYAPKANKAKKP